MAPGQLVLPGFDPPVRDLVRVDLSARDALVVRVSKAAVEVDLSGRIGLRVPLDGSDYCLTPDLPSPGWPLWEKRPDRAPVWVDVFAITEARVSRWMARRSRRTSCGSSEKRSAALAALRLARQAAIDLADPEALRLANLMHPRVRWLAYRGLVRDRDRRFCQLIDSCPGAVVLAAGLACRFHVQGRPAANALIEDVAAGRRLGFVVDRLLAAWAQMVRQGLPGGIREFEASSAEQRLLIDSWERALRVHRSDEAALIQAQRLLVRRTPRDGWPAELLVAAPPGLVPEDVPADPAAFHRWIQAMTLAFRPPTASVAIDAALSSWVSRHVEDLARVAKQRGMSLVRLLFEIRLACARQRYSPVRTASVARLLEVQAACLVDRALPPPPPDDHVTESVQIRRLHGAVALAREGAEMEHCVATYAGRVEAGRVVIYSVRVDGQRSTVSLARDGFGWRISEHHGPKNARPSPECERALDDWLPGARRNIPRRGG